MKHLSPPAARAVLIALLIVMAATRFHHVGSLLHLPDASMALFFLGGFYLRRYVQYALLLGVAVLIDYLAIRQQGMSFFQHYCVTPAYYALLLSYAVLWQAGRWVSARREGGLASLGLVWVVGVAAAAVSFLISNGAFYWFGGRYPDPNWNQYLACAGQWGPLFVRTTATYLAVALALHYVVARRRRTRAAAPAKA
ncbi:hypothetical protein P6166_10665 [Stenotrophomonas sp. HITSZ_GD]|uniref:hypothetical protein n=1 Tax=Stenotrophomonas sp. HITSZ_GD TaxID=3037248 RepID=UPI00240D9ADA|nr:hypothetical protein [Stenotrophomonas sp. HITSZ_GD]MDG2525814.1 hypothetical protein [Stenotrophomonas sp. HITSZ_GD]